MSQKVGRRKGRRETEGSGQVIAAASRLSPISNSLSFLGFQGLDRASFSACSPFTCERDRPITLSFTCSYALLPPVTRMLTLEANSQNPQFCVEKCYVKSRKAINCRTSVRYARRVAALLFFPDRESTNAASPFSSDMVAPSGVLLVIAPLLSHTT